MQRVLRLTGVIAIGALLAGCAGGLTSPSSSIPTAQSVSNTAGGTAALSLPPRTMVGSDGRSMAILYTRGTEASIRTHVLSKGAGSVSNLLYNGGPVQTAPKIYVTFWGSAWNSSGDPDGVKAYYTNFINGVGGSSWLGTVTQYTQSNGQQTGNGSGSYAGSWVDTVDSVPTSSLNSRRYQSAIAAEAAKAAAHFGDYSANASYVIAFSHGVKIYQFAGNYSGGNGYCAWHSSASASGHTIAYTNLPYVPDAGYSCGSGSVNNPGTNDGVSIVGGHEQAETETDPQPNSGWLDSSGAEIGDKCAWINLQNTSFSTGSFPTQPLWSNAVSGCVQ